MRKTLGEFDYPLQPSVNKKQATDVAGRVFDERTENVILLDPPVVGKMHLGTALEAEAAKHRAGQGHDCCRACRIAFRGEDGWYALETATETRVREPSDR